MEGATVFMHILDRAENFPTLGLSKDDTPNERQRKGGQAAILVEAYFARGPFFVPPRHRPFLLPEVSYPSTLLGRFTCDFTGTDSIRDSGHSTETSRLEFAGRDETGQ
jgi:hypothetical protein